MTTAPSRSRPASYPSGVTRLDKHLAQLDGQIFRTLERESDAFLGLNRRLLRAYGRRWIIDPFHTWSRTWEYPFCAAHLDSWRQAHANRRPCRLLDAGSGVTFFPGRNAAAGWQVTACDADPLVVKLLGSCRPPGTVRCDLADLAALPYADRVFDAVVCISVLEHLSDPTAAIRELVRVLAPGGLLLVTFDLSIDGRSDIPLQKAPALLDELASVLGLVADAIAPIARDMHAMAKDPRLFLTTDWAREHHPEQLPWRASWLDRVTATLRTGGFTPAFFSIGVCCVAIELAGDHGSTLLGSID